MNQVQLIREFAKVVIQHNISISKQRLYNNWEIVISMSTPYLYLPVHFNLERDEADQLFRDNFVSLYNPASKLSDVTLSLLHELGHWMTRFDFDEDADEVARKQASTPQEYLAIKSEVLATAWAVEWLSNHYELAKQFDSELMFA